MILVWLIVGILWIFLNVTEYTAFFQDDYVVKLEILQIVNYNSSYIRQPTADLVWFNRTTRTMNCSCYLLKDLNQEFTYTLQVYKFVSNEYREFPIFMKRPVCEETLTDPFGIMKSLKPAINFKFACPFKKGFYSATYGTLNFSRFPPHMIRGRYRCQVKGFDKSNFILEAYFDAEVIEVIKKWKN